MSSEYYFKQWKCLLQQLQTTLDIDIHWQTDKVHDQKLRDAVQRLSGMLGKYIFHYNQLVESARMNLQVQKAKYMEDLIQGVVARIIEFQHQISKLDGSTVQFLSKSLIDHKLTTGDVELTDIPQKMTRPDNVNEALVESMRKAEEERKRLEEEENQTIHSETGETAWWLKDGNSNDSVNEEEELNEDEIESKKRQDLLNLIAAHEKTRQTLMKRRIYKAKREIWSLELAGKLEPPARIELRRRAAQFLQRIVRAYFEVKRKKIEMCNRDKRLGFRMCIAPSANAKLEAEKILPLRQQKLIKYKIEWKQQRAELKLKLYKKRADTIAEDHRDFIRDWFLKWYNEVMFFYDVPSEKKGGSALILREELPTSSQWLEEYKKYQAQKKNPRNSRQLKQEKSAAKKEEQLKKKEEKAKQKMEAAVLRKIMKDPGQHPGYTYPTSKKTDDILKAIESYHKDWDSFDAEDTFNIKERHIKAKDESDAWMEIKEEVITKTDKDMRTELKKLRIALKKDYTRRNEEMPVMIPEPKRKQKKKDKKVKDPFNETIPMKLEKLALRGFLREYPKIKFENIMGDPNFAGEDLRAEGISPMVMGAEMRRAWWERCRKLTEGFQRVLIIGPKGSGKTTLAYALATINDAVFIDLDPSKFVSDDVAKSEEELQDLANSVIDCARAVQPAVIYIKHIQRLYYRKAPTEEPRLDQELIVRCLIKPLSKKIQKMDSITLIGTCVDPWLTKGKQMLRQFPNVLLTPTTSFSLTYQILRTWMTKNRAVPPDLDVHSLAFFFQGYRFDFLTETLQAFLSADRVVKIAVNGLSPEEVYSFVMDSDKEGKPDYGKYLDWYSKKTPQGKSEKKHLMHQQAFLKLEKQLEEKMANKKKKPGSATASAQPSLAGSL